MIRAFPLQKPTICRRPNPSHLQLKQCIRTIQRLLRKGCNFTMENYMKEPVNREQSTLRIVDIKTGKPEKEYLIPDTNIFGEGITIFKNKIYQLTWQNNKIFVYKLMISCTRLIHYNWSAEGWGITNDGNNLIISDGSSKLYYVQPDEAKKEMKTIKILTVAITTENLIALMSWNILMDMFLQTEWYNNQYIKIDTSNGHAVGIMDLTGLLHQYDPNDQVERSGIKWNRLR